VRDVGLRLLDSLYEQMMIDDEWVVRRERGFTWWAYRLAQHFEVGPPAWSEDRYICTVRIWTEVVRGVDPSTDPASVLAAVNPVAQLNALVWDPADATIIECCTATVHDEIFTWLSKVLSTAAVLQNTAAHSRAKMLASATGGTAAASNHPKAAGMRLEMDGLLNVPEQVIAPQGARPSQFVGAHFQHVEGFMRQMQLFGNADSEGLTCEVPFSGHTPSIALPEGAEPETSLIKMFTDAPNPDAGNGLLCIMRLPCNAEPRQIAAQANRLNLIESRGNTGTLLLGAWCPDPSSDTTLAFCAFVPNALAQWVAVENLISYMSTHSQLAARFLDEPAASAIAEPSMEDAVEQLRDSAKSAARASSQIAASLAKQGIANLRRRLNERRQGD